MKPDVPGFGFDSLEVLVDVTDVEVVVSVEDHEGGLDLVQLVVEVDCDGVEGVRDRLGGQLHLGGFQSEIIIDGSLQTDQGGREGVDLGLVSFGLERGLDVSPEVWSNEGTAGQQAVIGQDQACTGVVLGLVIVDSVDFEVGSGRTGHLTEQLDVALCKQYNSISTGRGI